MDTKQSSFTFVGYNADIPHGLVTFSYGLHVEEKYYTFHEKLTFPPSSTITLDTVKPILDNILLVLGITYWKTYCPQTIHVLPFKLSREQANFWNLVYTKGLGEFFYKNQIDFRNLIQFPYADVQLNIPQVEHVSHKSLVLLGGGKDSIVTVELLKKYNKEFSLFSLNPRPVHHAIADTSGVKLLEMARTLDPQLFELNKQNGVHNGHVPISAIWAFISLFASVLYDATFVITSNEVSANYGNVEYLGQEVNHQWSKSFEFEQAFQQYIKKFVRPDKTYFSLLRPIHEIEIVKLFSEYTKYFHIFSSCNRNFKIIDPLTIHWCGECPKCAFVFLLLSAFLSKAELISIFKKNLFSDIALFPIYKELLGLAGFKPFECVGTPEESLYAFSVMVRRGEYTDDPIVKELMVLLGPQLDEADTLASVVLTPSSEHAIPDEFHDIVSSL